MTNDRYNDHIDSVKNIVEKERLKDWIKNNCINYTFISGELCPDPEIMKAKNIV